MQEIDKNGEKGSLGWSSSKARPMRLHYQLEIVS